MKFKYPGNSCWNKVCEYYEFHSHTLCSCSDYYDNDIRDYKKLSEVCPNHKQRYFESSVPFPFDIKLNNGNFIRLFRYRTGDIVMDDHRHYRDINTMAASQWMRGNWELWKEDFEHYKLYMDILSALSLEDKLARERSDIGYYKTVSEKDIRTHITTQVSSYMCSRKQNWSEDQRKDDDKYIKYLITGNLEILYPKSLVDKILNYINI
jgi:hypothetical protein